MAITTYATLVTAADAWLKKGGIYDTTRIPEWLELAEDWIAANLRIRLMEEHVDLVVSNSLGGGTVGGTANAITLTPTTALAAYVLGTNYTFEATATNTGAVTVAISGLAATAVNKGDGTIALEANDIANGSAYYVYYDGTRFRLLPRGAVPLPRRFIEARRLYLQADPVKPLQAMVAQDFWTRYLSSTAGEPDAFCIEEEAIVFGPRPDTTYYGKLDYYRRFVALDATNTTTPLITRARGLYLYGILVEGYAFLGDDQNVAKYAMMRDSLLEDVHRADRRGRFSGGNMQMRSNYTMS